MCREWGGEAVLTLGSGRQGSALTDPIPGLNGHTVPFPWSTKTTVSHGNEQSVTSQSTGMKPWKKWMAPPGSCWDRTQALGNPSLAGVP